jgi:hypothetical protein
MRFFEDHQGGDVTELEISDQHAVIVVTHDYRDFFKLEICNRDGSPIAWKSNWVEFNMHRTDGDPAHRSFGELEIVQIEDGHVYIDSDFGSFDFTANQTIPPSKNA